MATSRMRPVLDHLRLTMGQDDEAGLADAELLGHFIEHHDEASFAVLVRRHGPMVMGVCLRVARNRQDAEDAFQAAFLVLVRKAASIAPREQLANWLYGVGYKTALKAKATTAKRWSREKQVMKMPETAAAEQELWSNLLPVLDQELNRLPDKYRIPIVICDLEGKTQKKAAQQLGCPEKSLATRLSRARRMLAKRLARHGLAVSGGSLALALAENSVTACLPIRVMFRTVQGATLVASGQAAGAVMSARVAAISEGVVKAMLLQRIRITAVVIVLAALACCGVGSLARHALAGGQAQAPSGTQAQEKTIKPLNAAKGQLEPAPEEQDQERLRGAWKLEKTKQFGQERTASSRHLTFIKDKIEYQTGSTLWEGTLKIDQSAHPRTMDLVIDQYTMRWIYRLEADKLVIAEPNGWWGQRPKDFSSTEGDNTKIVCTFARVSTKKQTAAADEEAKEARMKRARLECGGSLQRLVMAMHKYVDDHNHFPLAASTDGSGKPLLSWRVAILPYLGEKQLYEQFHQDEPWDSAHNRKQLARMPKIFASVGNPPKNNYETFYQVFVGEGCLFEAGKKIGVQDIEDGTVVTLAIIEAGTAVPWTKPADLACDAGKPLPSLAGGTGGMINDGLVSFAFADASVAQTTNTVDEKVLRPFILRSTGTVKDRESLRKGE